MDLFLFLSILTYKPSEDILDKFGRTPLHLAAKFGRNERMAVALARLNPHSLFLKDAYGKTPVMLAEERSISGPTISQDILRGLRLEVSRFYLASLDSPTDTIQSVISWKSAPSSDDGNNTGEQLQDPLTMEDVVAVVGDTENIVKPRKSVTFSVKHQVKEVRRVNDLIEEHQKRKALRRKCTIL